MSKELEFSESLISQRIRNMKEVGALKEYNAFYLPFDEVFTIFCFIEAKEYAAGLLSCFYKLPNPISFHVESKTKFCVQISLPLPDLKAFMQGLDKLKNYMDSVFIQTLHSKPEKRTFEVYFQFNKNTNRWELPRSEEKIIKEFAERYK